MKEIPEWFAVLIIIAVYILIRPWVVVFIGRCFDFVFGFK